jgi:ribonuclease HI
VPDGIWFRELDKLTFSTVEVSMPDLPNGIVIVVDGGCHNNQDAGKRHAYGSMAVYLNGERKLMHYQGLDGAHETKQARVEFGPITNNQAELKMALIAVGYVRELYGRSKGRSAVTIVSDSLLVVDSVSGINKKFKVPEIKELVEQLKSELQALPTVTVQKVDRSVIVGCLGH